MILKVCGNVHNISDVAALQPDLMGFIFYNKSPRHISEANVEEVRKLPPGVTGVGVFVDAIETEIESACQRFGLRTVQLHGAESPELCRNLKEKGYTVYKAFGVRDKKDMDAISKYSNSVDMIVLDTKTETHGGSGKKFDWTLLDHYPVKVPYLLSGGISPNDADAICMTVYPWMAGVDINSRFEEAPGLKNISLLIHFIKKIKTR